MHAQTIQLAPYRLDGGPPPEVVSAYLQHHQLEEQLQTVLSAVLATMDPNPLASMGQLLIQASKNPLSPPKVISPNNLPSARPGHARLLFLGTGTSEGIPRVSCLTQANAREACTVCWSARHQLGSRNRRRNTGVFIEVGTETGRPRILGIDCGKLWWESVLQTVPGTGIRCLDALLITHWHADAVAGLDDLRDFTANVPEHEGLTVHCNAATFAHVKNNFGYLVKSQEEVRALKATSGGVAELAFSTFTDGQDFEPLPGVICTPFNVEHGGCRDMSVFRIGSLAYVSDVSKFPEASRRYLRGAEVIVLDALQRGKTHPSHFIVEQAVAEVQAGFGVGASPKTVWLVGMNHQLDHEATNTWLQEQHLPCTMACAYDGLQIEFQLCDHRNIVVD